MPTEQDYRAMAARPEPIGGRLLTTEPRRDLSPLEAQVSQVEQIAEYASKVAQVVTAATERIIGSEPAAAAGNGNKVPQPAALVDRLREATERIQYAFNIIERQANRL